MRKGNFGQRSFYVSVYVIYLTLIAVLFSAPARGQITTGTIFGRVVDQSQAAVPAAKVKVTSGETGLRRSSTTDSSGNYEFPLLPIGIYTVEVEKEGFQTRSMPGVMLHVNEKQEIPVSLQLGSTLQVVEVHGSAPLLKTGSSDLGTVIENRRVIDLPLNGRDFMQLTLLTGGATETVNQSSINLFQQAGPIVSVNGQRENQNSFRFDGVQTYAPFYGNLPISPPIDSIQEFKVQTALYSADSGQFPGAQINVVTKGGTNVLHGSAYWFYRNHMFDAKNFFDSPSRPIPRFNRNQFGGSAGGPIKKDRTFWFGSYEGLKERKAITRLNTVPTVGQHCGVNVDQDCDLSAFGTIIDPLTGSPFPGSIIRNSRIDPVSRVVLQRFMPTPNLPGTTLNFASAPIRPSTTDAVVSRLDHSIRDSDQLSGRFMYQRLRTLEPFGGPAPILGGQPTVPGFGVFSNTTTAQVTVAETHIFSGNKINQFRMGFTHFSYGFQQQNFKEDFNGENGIVGTNPIPVERGVPQFVTAQFATVGDAIFTNFSVGQSVAWIDNFSFTKGAHSFKTGIEIQRNEDNPVTDFGPRGIFGFFGIFTGNRWGDFLLGLPFITLVEASGDSKSHGRSTSTFLYAQDDWRVTPKLTLNLGMRWEYVGRYVDRRCRDSSFDSQFPGGRFILNDSCGNIGFPVVQADLATLEAEGRLALASKAGFPSTLTNRYFRRFAPRVGFAWEPVSKLAIRGAYGIFWNQSTSNEDGVSLESTPWTETLVVVNFDPTITTQTVSLRGQLGLPGGRDSLDNLPGYVQQWGLNVQYTPTPNLLFEGAYVGSFGQRLPLNFPRNMPAPGPGDAQSRRRWPLFGDIGGLGQSMGKSWYHGFVGRVEKRYSNGFQLNAALTISKSEDLGSTSFNQSDEPFVPSNPFDFERADKGLSIFDVRRRLVISPIYELPFGRGKRYLGGAAGWQGKLVSDWMITSILTLRDGLPFTVVEQANITNRQNALSPDRPNAICNPNQISDQSPQKWFNTACFVAQAPFTYGNSGRNITQGPSLKTFDFSIVKRTEITEKTTLEFRAEYFNLANHPNLGTPVRILESPDFGKIVRTAADSRQIQFALKLLF
jgi:outer membrane receptor protein involved in Fe transport